MYFEEIRSEKKNPAQFVIALAAALVVNGALGAALLHGGIDTRLAASGARAQALVADLGTLPAVTVLACRAKV